MRAIRFIPVFVGVLALCFLAAHLVLNLAQPPTRDPHNTFYTNLRRISEAKQRWASEQKAAPDSWPGKRDILAYLTPHPERGFNATVPSLAGEEYIINRTDRPALVYFPKDAGDFREGQLLTVDDLQRHYDKELERGTAHRAG